MKWEKLYQYYDAWSPSTLANRLSTLEDYGPPEEIIEVADAACDQKTANRLIKKAILAGVSFSPEQILELDGIIDPDMISFVVASAVDNGTVFTHGNIVELDGIVDEITLSAVVMSALNHGSSYSAKQIMELDGIVDEPVLTIATQCSKERFSTQELLDLEGIVDQKVLDVIDKRQGTHAFEFEDDSQGVAEKEKRPSRLFKAFAAFGMLAENDTQKYRRFNIGEHVRVRYRGQEGTVVDINGDLYMVSLNDGQRVDSFADSQLEKAF